MSKLKKKDNRIIIWKIFLMRSKNKYLFKNDHNQQYKNNLVHRIIFIVIRNRMKFKINKVHISKEKT